MKFCTCVLGALGAVPAPPGERCLRVPGARVPGLGDRAGRIHPPPPLAGTGMEGRCDGPGRVPSPGPSPARMAADDDRIAETTEAPAPVPQGAQPMTRLRRALATLAMSVTLCAGVAPSPARAQ